MISASLSIASTDGFELRANAFEPAGEARAWVVLASAMGVKQDFYFGFARYLAEQGFAALTWDYRGVGASRPGPAGCVKLRDWAEKDTEAVLRWALERNPKVMLVGHSLGGQLLGLVPSANRLRAMVGVASQSGDWRHWPFPYDLGMLALSSVVLPGVTSVFGKLPKGLMGEEVPAGPIKDWARWIRSKGYLLSEGPAIAEQYARLTLPMTGFSISDDRYAPVQSVDRLFSLYRNAKVERIHLTPRGCGMRTIGHFGPFRRPARQTLWPLLLRPLERAVASPLEAVPV